MTSSRDGHHRLQQIIQHRLSEWTWNRQRKRKGGFKTQRTPAGLPAVPLLLSLLTHQSVTPATRLIWANSICTWEEKVHIHTCGKHMLQHYQISISVQLRVAQRVQCWRRSESRPTWPMTSRLLNEAELFFTVTLRRLNLSSSRGRSYSNLTGGAKDGEKWESGSRNCLEVWSQSRWPITSHCTRGSGLASSLPFSFWWPCFCPAAAWGRRSCPLHLCFGAADLCTAENAARMLKMLLPFRTLWKAQCHANGEGEQTHLQAWTMTISCLSCDG